ncbi:hypothetical protein LZ30DRAFT_748905 [Colletotrichum cereale]|nr:hypothetical protein LZ30DRAFT_748905 [Colletotrichum cereale]
MSCKWGVLNCAVAFRPPSPFSLLPLRPMDSSSPPSCSHTDNDYDGDPPSLMDGGPRNPDTHVRSAARAEQPANPWRSLEACEGFDLRTWVAAPASGPQSSTTALTMTPPPLPPSPLPLESGRGAVAACFPDLPYELHSNIWRIYLQRPRVVVIRAVMDPSGVEPSGNEFGNVACNARWYCENRSPALFRVCAEARREALSFFRIHLPVTSPEPDAHGYPQRRHRNPAWDRIYINPDWDLVLDLLAYDPLGEGVAHYGSNNGPWEVNPDPGFGMATLKESFAVLKSFFRCGGSTSNMTRPHGEGYVHAVAGEVGRAGMLDVDLRAADWTPAWRLVARPLPHINFARGALISSQRLDRAVGNNLVIVDLTTHFRLPDLIEEALLRDLWSTTDGWVIRLVWQPPDRIISYVMYLTTGQLRRPPE